ncbi:PadR family transcriptional regulator, regulatory protein PadR [Ekhidna lutea]|uniref:PadR family transcriptional regulator, regulatory protein PadR n=1 Tax=Ekhidna lutea TaxID=447679 RepID=A0A239GZW1_EKHLU|nr:PadR family transcriptional regulator [Ekhidna lutea]SNS74680.1 PadR family transcriptional regulator, regulatory protein PadR [Ekhidna lutea]
MDNLLTRTEEMLLLMVCRLQDEAYGMQIREEVKKQTGKQYSIGGIYVPLDRLVLKGYLDVQDENPTKERMGRPRRRFILTAEGIEILRKTREMQQSLWNLPEVVLKKNNLL